MTATPKPYPAYKPSGVPWLGDVPEHWDMRRGGWLFRKMNRPVRDVNEVITCFRDGSVTLRKNRRTEGFTESLKEIGYQGVRKGDLVPPRMADNAGGHDPYAKIYKWSSNANEIHNWIHKAFERRNGTPPNNSRPQFQKNRSGNCATGWQS